MHKLAIVVAAFLTACGGGGGGDDDLTTTTTNPNAVWAKLMTAERSWTTTGTGSDGNTYQITYALKPAGSYGIITGTYESVYSQTTMRRNGTVVPTWWASSNNPVGGLTTFLRTDRSVAAVRRNLDYVHSANTTALPTTAAVGASGPLYQGSWCYVCQPLPNLPDTVFGTWSFSVDDNGIPFFCVNRTEPISRESTATATVSHCVEVNAAGDILGRAKTTMAAQGGLTLTARN